MRKKYDQGSFEFVATYEVVAKSEAVRVFVNFVNRHLGQYFTVSEAAVASGTNRKTCYAMLYAMHKRGVVSRIDKLHKARHEERYMYCAKEPITAHDLIRYQTEFPTAIRGTKIPVSDARGRGTKINIPSGSRDAFFDTLARRIVGILISSSAA